MSNRDELGKFKKGYTGNPRGSSRMRIGLADSVREQEGKKFWRRLLELRDGLIKEAYVNEKGETVYSVPSVKEFVQVCELGLAYCYGRPSQRVEIPNTGAGPVQINFFLGSKDGSQLGFHVAGRKDDIDSRALPESDSGGPGK